MKRSEINTAINEALKFLEKHSFPLPPQAYRRLDDWIGHEEEAKEMLQRGIGWDVTDFGKGKYIGCGLLLYTLSNGILGEDGTLIDQPYAEKMLLVGEGQVTPFHHHWKKREDIVNQAGGMLEVKLYEVGKNDAVDKDSKGRVFVNNTWQVFTPGQVISLAPGHRIRLDTNHYHMFWAQRGSGPVLAREVSSVNNDQEDNCFNPPVGRFPIIEEDTYTTFPLCNELPGSDAFEKLIMGPKR